MSRVGGVVRFVIIRDFDVSGVLVVIVDVLYVSADPFEGRAFSVGTDPVGAGGKAVIELGNGDERWGRLGFKIFHGRDESDDDEIDGVSTWHLADLE